MTRTRYNFWIDDEQREGLRIVRERDGVLDSEQIRRAIDAWLRQKLGVKLTITRKEQPVRRVTLQVQRQERPVRRVALKVRRAGQSQRKTAAKTGGQSTRPRKRS